MLQSAIQEYIDYCRVEKGLSANTLSAYQRDLGRLAAFCEKQQRPLLEVRGEDLAGFVDSLFQAELSSRSIARYVASIRNFYLYQLRQDRISADPTVDLRSPKQGNCYRSFSRWKRLTGCSRHPMRTRQGALATMPCCSCSMLRGYGSLS